MKNPLNFLFWPSSKKILLLQAFFLLALIRVGLWLFPFKRLNDWLEGSEPDDVRPLDWEMVRETAALIRLSSRFIPRATCLTQALAGRVILRRMGQNPLLRIGVDTDENYNLIAHAWIEVEGKIIIGKVPDMRRYAVMNQYSEQRI